MQTAISFATSLGEKQGACGLGDRDTPPASRLHFYDHGFGGGSQGPHPTGGGGERVRYGHACPGCGAAKEEFFRVHDCRRRKFRLVLGRCIQAALSWILRWRCLCCGKRFADYPPFALPRKRFTKQPVLEKGGEYLGTDHSYAKTVMDQREGLPIMYDDRTPAGLEQAIGLAPARYGDGCPGWVECQGRCAAWDLIRQKEPAATLHRQPWVVPSRKYRSQKRRDMLLEAMQLLAVDRVCAGLFGEGVFPRYATSQGWS